MTTSRETLDRPLDKGRIIVERPALFGEALGPLGGALGNTSEGLSPAQRHAVWAKVSDYLPNPSADGPRVGLPSDDTQLAFRTLEQMLADGALEPANLS